MKFNKFEGGFGEFIEKYLEGSIKFYTLDAGHSYQITFGDVGTLSSIYKSGNIYVEAEEVWTDHLPVLCWVWDDNSFGETARVIVKLSDSFYSYIDYAGDVFEHARPVTEEEVNELVWKGGKK